MNIFIYLHWEIMNKDIRVMTTEKKYKVNLAPSGWAVYDNNGNQVKSFCSSREWARIEALTYMYELNGWNLPKGGFRS